MADPSATPVSDEHLNVGFFFQSRKYECGACGTNFVVRHVVMTSFWVAIIVFFGVYGVLQSQDVDSAVLLLLMVSAVVVVVVYDVYCRIRYPRVVSEK